MTDFYQSVVFDIQINGETICSLFADRSNSIYTDYGDVSCSAVSYAAEGESCLLFLESMNMADVLFVKY